MFLLAIRFYVLALHGSILRRSRRHTFCLLAFICLSLGLMLFDLPSTSAQVRKEIVISHDEVVASGTPQPTPQSVVSGRIVYDGTERPLRRVKILLASFGGGLSKTSVTDVRGNFRFENVPAGSYFVLVSAPGIVTPIGSLLLTELARNGSPSEAAISELQRNFETVTVDGKNKVEIKVRAKRGGAITGRINYENGDPAINVRVRVLRRVGDKLSPVIPAFDLNSFGGARTDDRGVYRIAGLPAGEYLIAIVEENTNENRGERGRGEDDFMFGAMFGGADALVQTYYGNTTKDKDATPVKLELGSEANEINVTLIDVPIFRLGGTVTARHDGQPLAGATIYLLPAGNAFSTLNIVPTELSARSVAADEQGAWSFANIPDGKYILRVEAKPVLNPNFKPPTEENEELSYAEQYRDQYSTQYARKEQEVTLAGNDQLGVSISVSEASSVSGTVVIQKAQNKDNSYCVQLSPINASSRASISEQQAYAESLRTTCVQAAGGKILFEGLSSGEYRLSNNGDATFIQSATLRGVDLTRAPLIVGDGEKIEGLSIVLSDKVAHLQTRVIAAEDNQPRAGIGVVIAPSDPNRWNDTITATGSNLKSAQSGADGTAGFSLTPGEYAIFILRPEEVLLAGNPDFLRARLGTAQRVTLQAGETKKLDLTLPAAQPK